MPEMPKPTKFGMAAKREAAQKKLAEINPTECPNRLGIIFDESGSMSGQPLDDAKNAVKNFTASCNQFDTSIAIYPLGAKDKIELIKHLTVDYDLLNLYVSSLSLNDIGTPLYQVMMIAMDAPLTRLVIFSDGDPTDNYTSNYSWSDSNPEKKVERLWKEKWLDKFNEMKKREVSMPHDTIFIGQDTDKGYKEMKWIAEQTGGIFIHFKDSLSLSSNLKYLAPALRGMLMNPEIKEKIQRGERI